MDNTNLECKPNGERLLKEEDTSDIFRLMVEEARQSFFQRENFIRSLEHEKLWCCQYKCNIIRNFFIYKKYNSKRIVICSFFLLIVSLVLVALCIWPRDWHR